MKNINLFLLILALFFSACNLEKEIELDLPDYDTQVVVECYLIPGKPFNLLLSKSSGYFDNFNFTDQDYLINLLEQEAEVSISNGSQTYVLDNSLQFDPLTQKVFNYNSNEIVPEDYSNEYKLAITLKNGLEIEGSTYILEPVGIDSIVTEFTGDSVEDTLANCLTYFTDIDPDNENYFRRMLHHNSLTDSIPDQDFISTDRLSDNGVLLFGSGYDYPVGDSIYNTLYHITPDYYEYYKTVSTALVSNGNPFAQPSTITSNVSGSANPIGIFTSLSFSRVKTIIEK